MSDLSPPSPANSDDHHPGDKDGPRAATPPRMTARGAYKSTSPAQNTANTKEKDLMELLSKAAAEIRVERRKVRQLLDENASLQEQVKTLKAKQSQQQRQQANATAVKEATELRQRYGDLMTVHKAMAVELEQSKEQLRTLQTRCREQQKMLGHGGPQPGQGGGSRSVSPVTYANRNGGRSYSAQPQPRGLPSDRLNSSGRSHGSISPSRQRPQHFDAMASVALSHQNSGARQSPVKRSRSSENKRVLMMTQPTPAPQPLQRTMTTPSRSASAAGTVQREAANAAEERHFNDMMLSRLRRAIAPPPTKEQMAEVVHAMVVELVRSAARNGLRLDLKRLAPCLYECGGKRRLHLTVDSRRLVVKCGGGHVDINEFIQRNRLWSPMEGSQQPQH
jgi:hypothetical protein